MARPSRSRREALGARARRGLSATVRAAVEYDGSAFSGFQRQPSVRTVAGTLEDALAEIFGGRVVITGAGRTDAGVHATGQVVSFALPRAFALDRLTVALQSKLPRDLAVRDLTEVAAGFSARRDARNRTYVYAVLNAPQPSPQLAGAAWHVRRPLDIGAMRAAAAGLAGEHDFRSFCGLPERGPTVRTLSAIGIERRGPLVRCVLTADGFLYHMVRAIVGTLVQCGHGRRDPASMPSVLEARDRAAAGVNAPAHGLTLAGVAYDEYESYREPWPFRFVQ